MSVDDQDTQSSRFPGHDFIAARERHHLSVEQVSTELHLPVKVIKAIESGNPQSFHNPVFIRGYIRTYAKHLGMDAAHYATVYANLPGVDLKPVSIKSTTSVKERDPSRSPFMKVFSWLFILVIIAIIIWWSQVQSGRSLFTSTEPPVTVTSSDVQPVDIEPELTEQSVPITTLESHREDEPESTGVSAENEAADDPEPLQFDEPIAEQALEEMATEQSVDNLSGLFMTFSGDCWVQIKDANDTQLYSGVAAGGSELRLEGELPLSLVIGRREAVSEITFNGDPVDLDSFGSGSVARFTLPLR